MSRNIRCFCSTGLAALLALLSVSAAWGADSTCKQTLNELNATIPGGKMPAADSESFLKDCGTQARRTCKYAAKQLKLDGDARNAHVEKCIKSKVG